MTGLFLILAFGAVVLGLSIWDGIVNGGDDTYAPRRAKREKNREKKGGQP